MTVSIPKYLKLIDWLDNMTESNCHTERVLAVALYSLDRELIAKACQLWLDIQKDGYLNMDNKQRRDELVEELNQL